MRMKGIGGKGVHSLRWPRQEEVAAGSEDHDRREAKSVGRTEAEEDWERMKIQSGLENQGGAEVAQRRFK